MLRREIVSAIGALGVLVVASIAMAPPGALKVKVGDPLPNLTRNESTLFLAGKVGFESVESVASGLGPVFNDKACSACHNVGAIGGGNTRVTTRFGMTVNGVFDPMIDLGGSLMQSQGIGRLDGINFVAEIVPAQATVVAHRRTTPLFGLGLVDNVPDAVLEQLAQEEQIRTPQTAGRVNKVLDAASGRERAGRFGWKCQEATLLSFSGDAYVNELGVTTPMFPDENCPQGNCAPLHDPGLPAVPNEPDNDDLEGFTNFMTFLAPPPSLPMKLQAQQGAFFFVGVGCADCHMPILLTGPNPSRALDRVAFAPFSDFLLHDMGNLADGIAQSGAGTHEMRTAPLWGVRFATTFLHDGRTTTFAGAIEAHDGQARAARDRFLALSSAEQAALIAFLSTL
jgi:CxxC motif-containing protein (DUF1111 family)